MEYGRWVQQNNIGDRIWRTSIINDENYDFNIDAAISDLSPYMTVSFDRDLRERTIERSVPWNEDDKNIWTNIIYDVIKKHAIKKDVEEVDLNEFSKILDGEYVA